jgi:chromosomal replication initiation ATPase DnaA
MIPIAANDASPEFEIARLSGLLAQECGADYAMNVLFNVRRALIPMAVGVRFAHMAEIAEEVALANGITVEDLKGPSRRTFIALPRQEAFARCYELRQRFGPAYSLPAIGKYFGDRHHTTVLHGVRAHRARQVKR